MVTTVKSAEIYQPIGLQNLPDGEYIGRWGGYQVTVIFSGIQYRLETTDGIRTMNTKCIVKIDGGSITVEAA